jgi:hypothetical protein
MKIEDFIINAQKQDKRNIFEKCNTKFVNLPDILEAFYRKANPVDVEIRTRKLGNIKFYPYKDLTQLNKDYSYPKSAFIFATTNGDPIFLDKGKVYTSYESEFSPEYLSESFEDFLSFCFL